MPTQLDAEPQPISEDALKLLIAQHGVRGTARLLEMDEQQTEAFRKRVQRAGWCQEPQMKPFIEQVIKDASVRPVVSTVSPMQALMAGMKEDAVGGRAAGLKVTRRALERANRLDDDELLVPEVAGMIHTYVKAAATAGGYGASDAVARVDLRVTSDRQAPTTVDAEWRDVPEQHGFVE